MRTRQKMPFHDDSLIASTPSPMLCKKTCSSHPELAIAGVSVARANSWYMLALVFLLLDSIQTRCKWPSRGPWDSLMVLHCLLFQIGFQS